MTLADHSYFSNFGTFLCDSEFERNLMGVKEHTVSLWSYLNRPEILSNYLNCLYEPNSKVIWPSVAPVSLVSLRLFCVAFQTLCWFDHHLIRLCGMEINWISKRQKLVKRANSNWILQNLWQGMYRVNHRKGFIFSLEFDPLNLNIFSSLFFLKCSLGIRDLYELKKIPYYLLPMEFAKN